MVVAVVVGVVSVGVGRGFTPRGDNRLCEKVGRVKCVFVPKILGDFAKCVTSMTVS